jgi:hypothetical protein
MSKTGFIMTVAVVVALTTGLMGCGGGGGNGDNGGGGTHPAALVGTWQVYQAENDGETVAPWMGWGRDAGTIRETIQFLAGGACTAHIYDDGGLAGTENGTWTVAAGVLTVTMPGYTKELTYAIDGNLATTTEDDHGTEHVVRWAKVVNLTGHDAALVRAWTVQSVETDGVDTPPATFFEWGHESDAEVLQFLADGTMMIHEIAGNEIVDHEEGTWATAGGEIIITVGPDSMRGGYVPNNTSVTFLDSDGSGVVFELAAYAPAGLQHDPAVVDTWQATSVTLDGAAVSLADFFNWDAGSDRMTAQFWADGTEISLEYAGTDIVYADISSWSTAGATMTLVGDGAIAFDNHVIAGNTVTLTGSDGGDAVVLVFTRV